MSSGFPKTADTKAHAEDTSKDTAAAAAQGGSANIADLAWRLAKNCLMLVARFYIMMVLVAYEWSKKIVTGMLTPFEPIFVQVRKVPKKDVSVEGIFYQFLRLQFLIVLYLTPVVRSWLAYLAQPLMRIKDWADDFVGLVEKTRRVDVQD